MFDDRVPNRGSTVWVWIGGLAVAALIVIAVIYGVSLSNHPMQSATPTAPATSGSAQPAPPPNAVPQATTPPGR